MLKKIIYHLLVVVAVFFTLNFLGNKLDKLNPIIKAISEIRFSDIYFSFSDNIKPSSEIYIVDIGNNDPIRSRTEIAHFIEKINKEYKPRVIGVDVYFDSKYKDEPINQKLIASLSMDNVIRMFKVKEDFNVLYPDFSVLSSLEINTFSNDGYTFGLGDATQHPCIRYYKPTFEIDGKTYNHFSKLIAQKYLDQSSEELSLDKNIEHKMMINYNTDFTDNRIDINDSTRYHELKDKIVLIGLNTYKNDGTPFFNDDLHFTPKNSNYIGRSAKDSYGIEILGTIISNLINDDHLSYNESFVKWLNWILSIAVYIFLLFVFTVFNEYFVFLKIFFQTIGVLLLAIISVIIISNSNYYIDLTVAIGVMFVSAEVVEIVEELLQKIPNYLKKN
jgi:CHASE2 domain-containing sensor protein